MNELDHIRTFLTIVETGSFTKAANRLAITKSVASRRISALEAELQTKLLNRTTRGVSPTTAGIAYFEQTQRILGELEDANALIRDEQGELAGIIRMATPKTFGQRFVQPALLDIMEKHPKIILDLNFSDRLVDIAGEGYDLGLRIGNLEDSSLIARKLANIRMTMVASPAYLKTYGEPRVPEDLGQHNCFIYTNKKESHYWAFAGRMNKTSHNIRVDGSLKSNNSEIQVAASIAGLGISRLPYFYVADHLKSGELTEIMYDFPQEPLALYSVYPATRHLTGRVRRIIDMLADYFSDPERQSCW